jgi:hypothetical protein
MGGAWIGRWVVERALLSVVMGTRVARRRPGRKGATANGLQTPRVQRGVKGRHLTT